MLKAVVYLILTISLVSVKAPVSNEKQIMTTLMNNFAGAHPAGYQFAVLYLHRDIANAAPEYDVSNFCGAPPKVNFIRQTIDAWAHPPQGGAAQVALPVQNVYDMTVKGSPVWPTSLKGSPSLNDCAKHTAGAHYPNIATAGRVEGLPRNLGHSENFLNNKVISMMMLSYSFTQPQCPGAAFLYTNLSPCGSCAEDIKKMAVRVRTTKVRGKECQATPFYVGYTNMYKGDRRQTWAETKDSLVKAGITVLDDIGIQPWPTKS